MNTSTGERQGEAESDIRILGLENWTELFSAPLWLNGLWMSPLECAQRCAQLYGLSMNWGITMMLLNRNYRMHELEVEFVDTLRKQWGTCVWYREHPSYQEPVPEPFDCGPSACPSLYHAMFETEHAGDQKVCLFSPRPLVPGIVPGFLPRIVPDLQTHYRKVVFAPPEALAA